MRVLTGQRRQIGLWGGQNLDVQSNSPNVVPNDGFLENVDHGGAAGYWAGSEVAGEVYDWGERTIFTPLPEAGSQ